LVRDFGRKLVSITVTDRGLDLDLDLDSEPTAHPLIALRLAALEIPAAVLE
jgi:hypothetical protein